MRIALILIASFCFLLPSYGNASSYGLSTMASSMLIAAQKNQPNLRVKNRQQATQMVKSQYGGKVLSVQSTKVNGNPGYRAKLLSADGVVFYVSIDAVSGQMSRR